jgi:hypothetical protein
MQRFRLLRFYVAGLVAIVGLAIGAVSMIRSAFETRTQQASTALSAANTEPPETLSRLGMNNRSQCRRLCK